MCVLVLDVRAQQIPRELPCPSPGRWERNTLGMRECRCPDGTVPNLPTETCDRRTRKQAARAVQMIIGRNAVGFHLDLAGTKVTIDPDLGDIRQTPLLSDRVLIHDMLGLPYKEKTPFEVRQSTGLENALAVIYERKRYIVYDPRWVVEIRSTPGFWFWHTRSAITFASIRREKAAATTGWLNSRPMSSPGASSGEWRRKMLRRWCLCGTRSRERSFSTRRARQPIRLEISGSKPSSTDTTMDTNAVAAEQDLDLTFRRRDH